MTRSFLLYDICGRKKAPLYTIRVLVCTDKIRVIMHLLKVHQIGPLVVQDGNNNLESYLLLHAQ